ncbi:MAG: GNAT family N-acetyltransferase [Deinococcales bacterium]
MRLQGAEAIKDFLTLLEACYQPLNYNYRRLSVHEPLTAELLIPVLKTQGWECNKIFMMLHTAKAMRPINPDVRIESIDFAKQTLEDPGDFRKVYADDDFEFYRLYDLHVDKRLGGKRIFAYLDDVPVGMTGFFVKDGIARYRGVYVHPKHRQLHIASTMIQYIQEALEVKAQEALTIHVGEDGPVKLYEALGFSHHSVAWDCLKKLKSES